MKIPIKHVIDSGAWFKYHGGNISCGEYYGSVDFRFRVLSFEKIDIKDIDEPTKLNAREYNLSEGDYWTMRVEIVNLTKITLYAGYLTSLIVILDQDGFEFGNAYDNHLTIFSKYAQKSGLDTSDLTPKIKYMRAIAYFLPKEDGAEYFLSVNSLKGGNIQEV